MVQAIERINRRALLIAAATVAGGAIYFPKATPAQETATPTIATPSAAIGGISPVGVGEVPTTGTRRPGPAQLDLSTFQPVTVEPVGLAIETAGVDAGIEALRVVEGALPDPTGPWVVAWYENLGALGRAGNVVMAGHIDYWNVGPSVFYNLAGLQPGDPIVVSGDDGKTYPYAVEWVRQYDYATMPLDEVAEPTEGQSLTLITCGGAFDYVNGQYLQRTVVRATRTGPAVAAAA